MVYIGTKVDENRIGKMNINTNGTPMKIIEYVNAGNITVEFQDKHKYTVNTTYSNFKRRTISNPYSPSIYGIGYIGEGKHPNFVDGKNTKPYTTWKDMLRRCYYEKERDLHLAYYDCSVCDEWLNFQTFADWYEINYYEIGVGRMHIDKDILVKDNKVYSPETCIFVPQRINMIFMKKNREVDKDLPTGMRRTLNGFMAQYNNKYLGIFNNLDDALYYYNIEKQLHINEVAEEYKLLIPPKLYNALLNWNRKIAA